MCESNSSSAEEVQDDSREESARRDGADKDSEQLARYMQIHIAIVDQHKTTYTCPFGTFTYTRMSFDCAMLRRCMISIFSDLLEDYMEVFMDDFIVYIESLKAYLDNLSRVLRKCIESNLVLNFDKCHFMVIKGIVLGHLVSARGIEVDKVKVDIISFLSNPTSMREVRSFLRPTSVQAAIEECGFCLRATLHGRFPRAEE
ncbi:Retrovirus-related Pol polyprotein, partial [Mucuna pruriens]